VRVRYGYRRIHVLSRREGWPVNIKRLYRLYREEGLALRYKRPEKRVSVPRVAPPPAARPNERWSIDFRVSRKRGEVLAAMKQALAQQCEPGTPVHLSLQRLEPVHVTFRLPIAPLQRQSRPYCRLVEQ
jgi:hypothetical protein